MTRWTLMSCILMVGCGGSGAPADTADDVTAPVEDDSSDSAPAERTEGSNEGAEEEAPADDAVGAASNEDIKAVLQLVVDDPELDKYLHLGEPGRFPLAVSTRNFPDGIELVKATKPVRMVDTPGPKDKALLVFTQVDVTGKTATIKYRYDIEGIKGTAILEKGEFGWEIKNSRQVEHRIERSK